MRPDGTSPPGVLLPDALPNNALSDTWMQPPSRERSPPAFWLRSHLDLAHHLLDLQQQLRELTAQVEEMRTAQVKQEARRKIRRLLGTARTIGTILSTPWGQTLLGLFMAGVAGAIKWLMGHF